MGAGLLLLNHQIVSGLQIENFHYSYFWGPLCSALVLLVVLDLVRHVSRRWLGGAVVAVVGLQLATGIYLRVHESTDSLETVRLNRELGDFKRHLAGLAEPKTPNSVIAGDRRYLRLSTVLEDQRCPFGKPA